MIITSLKLTNSFPVGTIKRRRKKAKWDKTKIRVRNSVKMKVGEINENIRERKIRRMRKDLVSCSAHIASILFIYRFFLGQG